MIEVFCLRSLVLKPYERSVRRTRLVPGKTKQLTIPAEATDFPCGLSHPKLFIIRNLNSHKPHRLAVCPASHRHGSSMCPSLGLSEVLWRFDRLTDPPTNKLIFKHILTDEVIGEIEMDAMKAARLSEAVNQLGDRFEVTLEWDHSLSIIREHKAVEHYHSFFGWRQVSRSDPDVWFYSQLLYSPFKEPTKLLRWMILHIWTQDRVVSSNLLEVVTHFRDSRKAIPPHLQTKLTSVLRKKRVYLALFLENLLNPLDSALTQNQVENAALASAKIRTSKAVRLLERTLECEVGCQFASIKESLSIDLIECVPIDELWWRKVESCLPSSSLLAYQQWLAEKARTWILRESEVTAHGESWCLPQSSDNRWENFFGEIHEIVREHWHSVCRGVLRGRYQNFAHPSDSGSVDSLSRFFLVTAPQLRLCTEFPWVTVDADEKLTLKVASYDRYFTSIGRFLPNSQSPPDWVISYSDTRRAARITQTDRQSIRWSFITDQPMTASQTLRDPGQTGHKPGLICLEGTLRIDSTPFPIIENEQIVPRLVTQLAASKTDLFMLLVKGESRAILRVPFRHGDSPISAHLILENDAEPTGQPNLFMQRIYSKDPRYSHSLSYFLPLRTLVLAESMVGCHPNKIIRSENSNLGLWFKKFPHTDTWRMRIRLTAVEVDSDLFRCKASQSYQLPLHNPDLMLADVYDSFDYLGSEDLVFQFRWQLCAGRLLGIWMRDQSAYTVFVLRGDRFTIAVQRSPKSTPLCEADRLVATSFGGQELPIVRSRCHSWAPGCPLKYSVVQIRVII